MMNYCAGCASSAAMRRFDWKNKRQGCRMWEYASVLAWRVRAGEPAGPDVIGGLRMPFQPDVAYDDEVGQLYGKYLSTFDSDTGQVRALIFEQNGQLVAHVSFPTGLKPEEVTDAYSGKLYRYAKDNGFEGKLRVIYYSE